MHPATWWPALMRMSLVHTTRRRAIAAASVLTLIAATLVAAITASAPAAATAPAASDGRQFRVLVFTKAVAGTHASTNAGVAAIEKLGRDLRFTVQVTNDASKFDLAHLKQYRVVVFLNTSGDVLNAGQQAAFEEYYRDGGGFLGVHSAIETEPDWSFLTDLLGTRASGSSAVTNAVIKVADRVHPASEQLPQRWSAHRPVVQLHGQRPRRLARAGHGRRDDLHRRHDGVRPPDHLVQGLPGRSVVLHRPGRHPGEFRHDRPARAPRRGHPVGGRRDRRRLRRDRAGQLPDGLRRGPAERERADRLRRAARRPRDPDRPPRRRAAARPATNTTHLLAQIPVYMASEDGMYGPAVDNDFATNKWVYLYYSPLTQEAPFPTTTPTANAPNTGVDPSVWDPWLGYFQLSRFKFVDGPTPTLDLATEQKILKVPVNRGACCHVAGDIDFDSANNLWMVTGDDTPAGGGNSGGFSPHNDMLTTTGLYNAPHVDARRSAHEHQRPARQDPADHRAARRLVHHPARQPVHRQRGGRRQDPARDLRDGLPQPVPHHGRR